MTSTGYFHLIRICSYFLQISPKLATSESYKSLVFPTAKNDLPRLKIMNASVHANVAFYLFYTPCIIY